MKAWHPTHDGLTVADFLAYCDHLGFVAVGAALRRNPATIRRAYLRLRETVA